MSKTDKVSEVFFDTDNKEISNDPQFTSIADLKKKFS